MSIEVLLESPTELLIAFASTAPDIVAGRVWRSEKTPVAEIAWSAGGGTGRSFGPT